MYLLLIFNDAVVSLALCPPSLLLDDFSVGRLCLEANSKKSVTVRRTAVLLCLIVVLEMVTYEIKATNQFLVSGGTSKAFNARSDQDHRIRINWDICEGRRNAKL